MKQEKPSAAWLMQFAGEKRRYYLFSVVLAIGGTLCQMVPYLLTARILVRLLQGTAPWSAYAADCLWMVLFWGLRVVLHGISTACSHRATFAVLANMRRQGLLRLEKMPLGQVQRLGSGNLKSILVERIDSIETTLAHMLPELTSSLCAAGAILILLFVIDWRMALTSLITLPIGLLCFMGMMIGYQENFDRVIRATKVLNDTAVEYIGGIEVIKVFGKAKSSYQKFVAAAEEGAASYVDWMRKTNLFFTFSMNIMPATLITVLPIGGLLVKNGSLSLSDFLIVVILSMGLIPPLLNCMSFSDDISKLGLILREVQSILEAPTLERPARPARQPQGHSVALHGVRFGYDDTEVLHGIDVHFRQGTVNAIVGPSGGGKSTIAKLIASFWDVREGSIELGGVDIRQLPCEQYHSMVAYVSQDNFLFNDTVRENIRMGRPDATDEQVEQAAEACGCRDFILGLEHGFDTVVGSGGGHLSGGERQRICIARAMLKNAPIVILDEATAYTDPENEALIQSSVARLVQGKTLIVIAHHLSTVVDADQIVVVDKGRVAGCGTHAQLLTQCPVYQTLWQAHLSAKDGLSPTHAQQSAQSRSMANVL